MCMVGGRLFKRQLARAGIIARGFLRSQEGEARFSGTCLLLGSRHATLCHTCIEKHEQNSVSHYILTDLN